MVYTSRSQLARVLSEGWVAEHGYCLACDSDRLVQTAANTQARDFECEVCRHPYELKSSVRPFGAKIVDGAFVSMMRRIESKSVPSFLLLRYTETQTIADLTAVHRSLITPEIIERRNPLAVTARRAGWVGCNILLSGVPPEGRIRLIDDGIALPKKAVRSIFTATENLASESTASRSWARAVLACLHRLPSRRFTLRDAYQFEGALGTLHPANRNVRAKIRQQLQVLRDAGLLSFEGRGRYRLSFGTHIE